MPFSSSMYARNHWLVEPALTPTFWPSRSLIDAIDFSATMPSPPTDASSPSTCTLWMPLAFVRENVSGVVAIASRLPLLSALKRWTGSSTTVYSTLTPAFSNRPSLTPMTIPM